MKREYRKRWIVTPQRLPAVIRRCPKCGQKTEFENSGRFRVNANGRLLDVWLIYRRQLFTRNKAEAAKGRDGYRIQVVDTAIPNETEKWIEAQIRLGGCLKIRVDALFAQQLGISRSQVKRLCEAGLLCEGGKMAEPGSRVRDGQVYYVSREWVVLIRDMHYTGICAAAVRDC